MLRGKKGSCIASPAIRAGLIPAMCLAMLACTPFKDGSPVDDDAGSDAASRAPDSEGDCRADDDCPRVGSCLSLSCEDRKCVARVKKEGVALDEAEQVAGDCRTFVCDGKGQTVSMIDDSDTNAGGNPCQQIQCTNGEREVVSAPDGAPCNETGICRAGTCSTCVEGMDCSRSSDCTEHRVICPDGKWDCVDIGKPRATGACEDGKVCYDGSCVSCRIGMECNMGDPCQAGQITDCMGEPKCETAPLSGVSCGDDAAGRPMFCVDGRCETSCSEVECMSSSDPCMTSVLDCSAAPPKCLPLRVDDGRSCGNGSVCREGGCVTAALVNGDFSEGTTGWDVSGDGAAFVIQPGETSGDRSVLSTSPTMDGRGGATRGAIAQTFVVPSDALALRFAIGGGAAFVRLKNADGAVIEQCTGRSSSSVVPVSWNLQTLRGQRVTIAIEDELDSGDWAYVRVSGFDVIRDVDGPLRNSQWLKRFESWETTGDGRYWNLWDDEFVFGEEEYGGQRSLSSYSRDREATNMYEASRGTVSQTFKVPPDAKALRFILCGGTEANVTLKDGDKVLFRGTGGNSDFTRLPHSWPLEAHRGKLLRLTIDDQVSGILGYLGVSGFDLITSYNGP